MAPPMTLRLMWPRPTSDCEVPVDVSAVAVVVVGIGVVRLADPDEESPIAKLKMWAAASWPQGIINGRGGPVQFGENQSVFGYLALFNRVLNFEGRLACVSNDNQLCRTCTLMNCSICAEMSEKLKLRVRCSYNARTSNAKEAALHFNLY